MLVEESKPYISNMLNSEPWRALADESRALCQGVLTWDGTALWHCKDCGRVGVHSLPVHYPPTTPLYASTNAPAPVPVEHRGGFFGLLKRKLFG